MTTDLTGWLIVARNLMRAATFRFRHTPPSAPLMVYVELTRRCNMRCRHCDIWKTWQGRVPTGEIQPEVLVGLLHFLARKGLIAVDLFGGEPLLRPDLEKIVTQLKEARLHVTVTTNGTLLDKDRAEALVASGLDQLLVSIDGPSAEIHDSLRGSVGAFERAVAGVYAFLAACAKTVSSSGRKQPSGSPTPRLGINTMVCKQNMDLLPKTAELAASLGATQIRLLPYHQCYPFNQHGQDDSLLLSEEDIRALPGVLKRFQRRAQELGLTTNGRTYIDRIPAFFSKTLKGAPCMAGIAVCDINAFGDVFPCYTKGIAVGNILKTPFFELWQSEEMKKARNHSINCAGCWQSCYIEPGLRLSPLAAVRDWRTLLKDVGEYFGKRSTPR